MPLTVLPAADWRGRAAAHEERADALTAGHRARRETRETHAIEDFLHTYYATRPGQLRRWHPGAGVALEGSGPDVDERLGWRWYTSDGATIRVDADALLADRGPTVRLVRELLSRTAQRPANVGCFGLHEWAMIYRQPEGTRHPLPLRLGAVGTDDVVESHQIRCSHIDAYRFFTPEAAPLNRLRPTRETQVEIEQPGCLHAAMDCYKWAMKLGPAVPGELLLDTFELAREIRYVDMQASPYDVSSYGLAPIAIETREGKAEYVRRQRDFARRSNVFRGRLVEICDGLLAKASSREPLDPAAAASRRAHA